MKGEPAYIRDLPPWLLEEPKGEVVHKFNNEKEYWWYKEHRKGQVQWFYHIP